MILHEKEQQFRARDFLSLKDYSREEVDILLQTGLRLKKMQKSSMPHNHILRGKTLAMIFMKSSTRTRVSFEVGIWQLGGVGLFLSANDLQLGRGETIADTARVLSRYVDGIMIRTFDHSDVQELARQASVPVINGLTDLLHPCQALADYLTILEHKGGFTDRKLVYIGDGNNMAHSLMYGAAKVGMSLTICSPSGYYPKTEILEEASRDAKELGCNIEVVEDPQSAVQGADVIYTDVWTSMGQEEQYKTRLARFKPYQVNQELLKLAKEDVIVMHCLPAHRNEEITDGVIDGPHSVVFDQAENRLHAQKAIMALLMSQ